MPVIKLDSSELLYAAQIGVFRRIQAIQKNRTHRFGAPAGDWWGLEIRSCAAEMAVAKLLDRFWHALSITPGALPGDVGTIQVRHTTRENGCLLLHPEDPDAAPFVLVTGEPPELNVVGWLRGADAKRNEWWREDTGRPAFFVPQKHLLPMNSLPLDAAP